MLTAGHVSIPVTPPEGEGGSGYPLAALALRQLLLCTRCAFVSNMMQRRQLDRVVSIFLSFEPKIVAGYLSGKRSTLSLVEDPLTVADIVRSRLTFP